MKLFHMNVSFILYCIDFVYTVLTSPQLPEINDQFENVTSPDTTSITAETPKFLNVTQVNEVVTAYNGTKSRRTELETAPENLSLPRKLFNIISSPFVHLVAVPKVNSVLRNIGTCMVNGAMEIVTYYFPAPLIPLIATAAGMIIPFEPVVMLREKMPVTSYRRAFRTALNSFLSTFDRYRLDDEEDDPYMTRRFNRRVMNYDAEEGAKKEEKQE